MYPATPKSRFKILIEKLRHQVCKKTISSFVHVQLCLIKIGKVMEGDKENVILQPGVEQRTPASS